MTPSTDWWHYPKSVQDNMMREAGVEPAYPEVPDPKTGTRPEYSPLQGLPGNHSRTGPHDSAPDRTKDVTKSITSPDGGAENVNRSEDRVALVRAPESIPPLNRSIRNVLRQLHGASWDEHQSVRQTFHTRHCATCPAELVYVFGCPPKYCATCRALRDRASKRAHMRRKRAS